MEQKPSVKQQQSPRASAGKRVWSYWRPVLLAFTITWWVGSADWAHFSLTHWEWAAQCKLSLGWGHGPLQYVTAAAGVPLVADGWWWFRYTEEMFIKHGRTLLPGDLGDLIDHGPFKRMRNPMFWGIFEFIIGASFLSGPAALGWAALFIPFIAFVYVPFHEEGQMHKRYGKAYADYKRKVTNRWIPAPRKRVIQGGTA